MNNFEGGFILAFSVFLLGLLAYFFISPDPLRLFSEYPSIDSISIEKIKSFEIDDDKTLIEKELGKGYETSSLYEEGIRSTTVVYKRIENKKVRLIKLNYTDEKLTSVEIN